MDPTNEIMTHLTTGAVVVYAIEWLKQWPQFRWMTADSGQINRLVSALAAAAIAFGISAQGDASTGWTITIPSAAVLAGGGWEFIKQFMLQQVIFDGVVQKAGKVTIGPVHGIED